MTIQAKGCPPELRDALNSPIPSIRPPFNKEGHIDFEGVRRQIDFLLAGKPKTLMLTWGDSLYSVMTDDEVAELTRVVVEHTRGQAKIIAADKIWRTNKTVEFARYCRQIGVDLLMLMPPDWAGSTTPATLVEHFNAVGEHIPVMLVTAFFAQSGVFGARTGSFRMDVIHALYERVNNMVAIKDDLLGDFGVKLCLKTNDRWAIVSGGLMSNHMLQVPYGVGGYLCLISSFKPQISWQYWDAVQRRDFDSAWSIIRNVEMPLFDFISGVEGGFNTAVHGMLEIFGICPRYLPEPYHTMTDEQMEQLRTFLREREFV